MRPRVRAGERMKLYDFRGYVLGEGETEGVEEVWVDGVKMDAAFAASNAASTRVLENGEFGPAEDSPRREPFWSRQYLRAVRTAGAT